LLGVYDANGTVIGELAYAVRRTVAGAHCALCDITHGRIRERPEWREARRQLPVPFVAFHRNDQPAAVRLVTGDQAPAVLAEFTDGHLEVLLDRDALDACSGAPQQLVDRILSLVSATPGWT
jgi:hypothetical protein